MQPRTPRPEQSDAQPIRLFSGASPLDRRFSYCAYWPDRPGTEGLTPQMLVVVHGSDYRHEDACQGFAALANEMHCVVLAPLFAPVGVDRPDPNGYKFLRSRYAAYDQVLLDMIEDVAVRFGAAYQRFLLFGFSGGAQFAHRLLYVYPERLHAVGIAAPGMVTLIDPTLDAWVGTRNLRARTGRDVDHGALRAVSVQLLIGAEDSVPHVGEAGEAAYNHAGSNRVERLRALAANYRAHGIRTAYQEVAGVGHDFGPLAAAAVPFLRAEIRRARGGA